MQNHQEKSHTAIAGVIGSVVGAIGSHVALKHFLENQQDKIIETAGKVSEIIKKSGGKEFSDIQDTIKGMVDERHMDRIQKLFEDLSDPNERMHISTEIDLQNIIGNSPMGNVQKGLIIGGTAAAIGIGSALLLSQFEKPQKEFTDVNSKTQESAAIIQPKQRLKPSFSEKILSEREKKVIQNEQDWELAVGSGLV
jgi:hypothetical protein